MIFLIYIYEFYYNTKYKTPPYKALVLVNWEFDTTINSPEIANTPP